MSVARGVGVTRDVSVTRSEARRVGVARGSSAFQGGGGRTEWLDSSLAVSQPLRDTHSKAHGQTTGNHPAKTKAEKAMADGAKAKIETKTEKDLAGPSVGMALVLALVKHWSSTGPSTGPGTGPGTGTAVADQEAETETEKQKDVVNSDHTCTRSTWFHSFSSCRGMPVSFTTVLLACMKMMKLRQLGPSMIQCQESDARASAKSHAEGPVRLAEYGLSVLNSTPHAAHATACSPIQPMHMQPLRPAMHTSSWLMGTLSCTRLPIKTSTASLSLIASCSSAVNHW